MEKSALDKQHGGNHYKDLVIEPVEYCQKNNLGYCESSAIKYLTRWKDKGGIEDLYKAKHFIEILIEMQGVEDHADNKEDKIQALESELELLVDQIFVAEDLDKLKELTKRNFPDEWRDYEFCAGEKQREWVGWHKVRRPDLPIETRIELKFYNGEIVAGFVGGNWIWQNVSAYRIIPEQKDKEHLDKKYCGSMHAIGECKLCKKEKMHQFYEGSQWEKEPKKQTLLEFALVKYFPTQLQHLSSVNMFHLISEYLEKNK